MACFDLRKSQKKRPYRVGECRVRWNRAVETGGILDEMVDGEEDLASGGPPRRSAYIRQVQCLEVPPAQKATCRLFGCI